MDDSIINSNNVRILSVNKRARESIFRPFRISLKNMEKVLTSKKVGAILFIVRYEAN
ncbi:Amp-ligase, partial [Fructobacillus tropaeoli]